MYQLIIHWDNKEPEIACEGTQTDIYNAVRFIAEQIDPDKALWEIKWVPAKSIVNQVSVNNIMGKVGKVI